MNFLGIGTGELLIILVIVLLVMGPQRLPEIVRQWAKLTRFVRQISQTWYEFNAELNRELALEEDRTTRQARAAKQRQKQPATGDRSLADAKEETTTNTIAPPELAEPDAPPADSGAVPESNVTPDPAAEPAEPSNE